MIELTEATLLLGDAGDTERLARALAHAASVVGGRDGDMLDQLAQRLLVEDTVRLWNL